MALTISKLKMWKDPGYTRGCLEVPPAGSKKLPSTPDYVLPVSETLRPHKATTLTELHLPIAYSKVFDMSYLYIEASDGAGNVKLFGWIDSIYQRSSSAEGVTILWSVDWWRSYSGSITFGAGVVIRCTDGDHKRPYTTQPRKWKVTRSELLCTSRSDHLTYPYWVIITYTPKVNDEVVSITTLFWQCNFSTAKSETIGGVSCQGVPLNQVFSGEMIGLLGLNPDEITSIYISPYQPDVTTTSGAYTHTSGGTTYFAYRSYYNSAAPGSSTFGNTYESDDMKKAVIVDPTGAIVYTLPWGESIDHVYYVVDTGTVGCNLDILLYKTSTIPNGIDNAPIGKTASLPCIAAPLCSNGWSSYNYSGQRDYDIQMKQIQREENAVKGVLGAGSSMIGGGIGGAMVGKGLGAGIGAGLAASTTIFTAGLEMMMSEKYDDQYQKATDQMYANQSSSILQSAGGIAFINTIANTGNWYIVQLEADDTSAAEYTADVGLNGYETNIAASDVTSYVTAGGALQIRNLNLTGNTPPQAKQYIKSKLETGVHIIENNPSGVAP